MFGMVRGIRILLLLLLLLLVVVVVVVDVLRRRLGMGGALLGKTAEDDDDDEEDSYTKQIFNPELGRGILIERWGHNRRRPSSSVRDGRRFAKMEEG
jgi:hypothetical protein